MTRIDVKANVTAPAEINIKLVRADIAATSHVFRVCFEVSLSLFSTLLGYLLGLKDPQSIHYVAIVVCGLASVAFLGLTYYFGRQSKAG